MKRSILILIISIIIIACGLIPFNQSKSITINSSYFNCYKQLFILNNWKNWQPDINKVCNTNSSQFKIDHDTNGSKLIIPDRYWMINQPDSYNLLIKEVQPNHEFDYNYAVVPDATGLTTNFFVAFRTTVFKYLFSGFGKQYLNESGIYYFKKFMEDPRLYYGFNIIQASAVQKKIIVKSEIIKASQLYNATITMQKQLLNYISFKHLIQTDALMVQYNAKQDDSVQVLMGIPVDKQIPVDNGFLYMYMPPTKTLVADFKGKYRDKQKIYIAVGKYMQDKYLNPKIAPFEVFENKFPASANDMVDFQLTYPIF